MPRGFNLNPKIVGLLARRAKMVEGAAAVDWGMAEALAFGSLLIEGTPCASQARTRCAAHSAIVTRHSPTRRPARSGRRSLSYRQEGAKFQIYDSPLSEAGALGFEYGYSVAAPESLVLWEAQFGDFVNAAQVIIDQFIAAGRREVESDERHRVVVAARLRRTGSRSIPARGSNASCSSAPKAICRS